MSRWRRAANVDAAQKPICAVLATIPGVTVALGHDDVLVGHQGRTYWFEIKSKRALRKDGTLGLKDRKTTDKQVALLEGWRGHYRIVSTVEEILSEIGCSASYCAPECPRVASNTDVNTSGAGRTRKRKEGAVERAGEEIK